MGARGRTWPSVERRRRRRTGWTWRAGGRRLPRRFERSAPADCEGARGRAASRPWRDRLHWAQSIRSAGRRTCLCACWCQDRSEGGRRRTLTGHLSRLVVAAAAVVLVGAGAAFESALLGFAFESALLAFLGFSQLDVGLPLGLMRRAMDASAHARSGERVERDSRSRRVAHSRLAERGRTRR
jgi:hypothetical protein